MCAGVPLGLFDAQRLPLFDRTIAGCRAEAALEGPFGQGGAGLGTRWLWEAAERMLPDTGFASPERHTLPYDAMNVCFLARKA